MRGPVNKTSVSLANGSELVVYEYEDGSYIVSHPGPSWTVWAHYGSETRALTQFRNMPESGRP